MTTLVTAGGRLLRSRSPRPDIGTGIGSWFPPMWSNGERWGPGGPNAASAVSYDAIYASQPTVAAAVNKLTRQAARLPLKVYKLKDDGERERLRDHPLETLLRRPMPRKGSVHLKQWAFFPLLIHGNSLLAKFRREPDGPPTELLPMDWRHVEAYAASGGPIEWWATTQTGERRFVKGEDTIHFAWQNDGEVGISPLEQLGTTIKIEDAAQRYQAASMANGVRPSSAVTVPPETRMNDPEVRRFYREQIEALHKGVDQAGKVALLSPGADIKPLSFSAADAQLIQQRKLGREEVGMVYDVAGPLIGDFEHATYSNVEEVNKQLYKSVLPPWLTLVEETIQAHLIDPEPAWEGHFVEFDMKDQLRGDPAEELPALKLAVEAGLMTRNEARKTLNLPRDANDAADQLFFAANNQAPIDEIPATGETTEPEPPRLT